MYLVINYVISLSILTTISRSILFVKLVSKLTRKVILRSRFSLFWQHRWRHRNHGSYLKCVTSLSLLWTTYFSRDSKIHCVTSVPYSLHTCPLNRTNEPISTFRSDPSFFCNQMNPLLFGSSFDNDLSEVLSLYFKQCCYPLPGFLLFGGRELFEHNINIFTVITCDLILIFYLLLHDL